MAFDWNEYINLAEKLISGNPSEAALRSATSRAYYGAFILCRNKSPYSSKKGGDVHFLVIQHYRREGATKEEYTISANLDILRIKRNEADYNSHYQAEKITTTNHINLARSTLKQLTQINIT